MPMYWTFNYYYADKSLQKALHKGRMMRGDGYEIGKNHIISAFLEKVSKKGKRLGYYIYPSYVLPRMAELH